MGHAARLGAQLALAVAIGLTLPRPAVAALINVDSQADDNGPGCTLREAVTAANLNTAVNGCAAGDASGTDTIALPASANHYSLTGAPDDDANLSGDLDIQGDVLIEGGGAGATIVDGGGVDRVFEVLLGTSELRDLTVTGGRTPHGQDQPRAPNGGPAMASNGDDGVPATGSDGGGVRIATGAGLTLRRVTVTGNQAGRGGDGGNGGAGGDGGVSDHTGGASTGGDGGGGGNGGGISNAGGTLAIFDGVVTGNTAGPGGKGGDAGQGGNATGDDVSGGSGGASIGGNGAAGGGGGGLFQESGATTLTRTLVSGNTTGDTGDGGDGGSAGNGGGDAGTNFGGPGGASTGGDSGSNPPSAGGGLENNTGSMHIVDSTIRDNRAGAGGIGGEGRSGGTGGSGILAGAGGASTGGGGGDGGVDGGLTSLGAGPTISGSALVGNRAGNGGDGGDAGTGGAGGNSTATGGSSTAGAGGRGGQTGGLRVSDSSTSVVNSTVASNRAGDGGDGGAASTSPAGEAGGDGGPGGGDVGLLLQPGASATLTHVTVAGNAVGGGGAAGGTGGTAGGAGQHPGIVKNGAGTLRLENTLLASNGSRNCQGPTVDGGHNLSFPATANGSCAATLHGDPQLGPVGNNGGTTPTMPLGAGSAAVDKVPLSGANCEPTDQRGLSRPKGVACDVGAEERSAPIVTTGDASSITTTRATVAGLVNPSELQTTYRFQFGRTTAHGSQTAPVSAGKGTAAVRALAALAGLAPNAVYHYRLVATNRDGTTIGADRTFTTKAGPFPGVKILTKRATVRKKRVRIKVSCRGQAVGSCAGKLSLSAKLKGKRRKLGRASFTVHAGRTARVTVKVKKKALKVLVGKRKLKANAVAVATDARGGTPVKTTRTVALKAPTGKGKKK
jgi:hypothetical protein